MRAYVHKHFLGILGAIVLSELAGLLGALTMGNSITTWYQWLEKPLLAPPNWIFGPVWTLLFALMGISGYLIWSQGIAKKKVKNALYLFGFHYIVNISWSFIFFGLQNPAAAFIEICSLWLLILACMLVFYKIQKTATWLLLPYLVWVSFAGYLNLSIWLLNGFRLW